MEGLEGLSVALIHHWLVKMRGAEKVLERFCAMFPGADIFTLVADRSRLSDTINSHRIFTSPVQKWPRSQRWYRYYLPAAPWAFEQFDLRGYDLVLTSDASVAKTVLPQPGALHVCYCHSPPRYLWNMYHQYLREECRGRIKRWAFQAASHYLRMADFCAAQRVDRFLCNSATVRDRIRTYYRRDATVIHPPVDLEQFQPVDRPAADYYLVVSQLNRYKRVDLAVQAFSQMNKRLVVIGDGPERGRLEKMAGPTVEFKGWVDEAELSEYYANCKAFVFPGEEDFGITPVEAQASGRPVIAYRKGGATETVVEGETGVFFDTPTARSLQGAVRRFEQRETDFEPASCRSHAERFSSAAFRRKCTQHLEEALSAKARKRDTC